MGLIFDRFGERGWMDVAKRTNERHLEPLRAQARKVIKGHRFEIRSLAKYPGMLEADQAAIASMIENVGKRSKYAGGGPGAFPDTVPA